MNINSSIGPECSCAVAGDGSSLGWHGTGPVDAAIRRREQKSGNQRGRRDALAFRQEASDQTTRRRELKAANNRCRRKELTQYREINDSAAQKANGPAARRRVANAANERSKPREALAWNKEASVE